MVSNGKTVVMPMHAYTLPFKSYVSDIILCSKDALNLPKVTIKTLQKICFKLLLFFVSIKNNKQHNFYNIDPNEKCFISTKSAY